MKAQLKNHIKLLARCDDSLDFDFEQFIKRTESILSGYECSFRFLRSDSKRNGHIKAKVNRLTGEYSLELAINRRDNIGGQVYTIIHELTHLLNNHMFNKELTRKQAEVVADTVAIYFLNKYNLLAAYLQSDVASKWDVLNYSNMYIDNMQLSKARYQVIIDQINTTKLDLEKLYLGES